MTGVEKWQNARYLIDAKKEIDSLWFIATHRDKINDDLKRLCDMRRDKCYINAASVVDQYCREFKVLKKDLCKNRLIERLYYYRDKHSAHKDRDYKEPKVLSLMEFVNECIEILKNVKEVCACILPDNITLDFLCYDGGLFRSIYGITKDIEELIKRQAHPLYGQDSVVYNKDNVMTLKVFNDTEELDEVDDSKRYCTFVESGLTFEEGLQNRQDWCIKTNVLYGLDI